MEPRPQHKNQNLQSRRKTKKKDGRMKSTASSDLKRLTRQKGNDVRNNDTWIKIAKHQKGWSKMENEFAMNDSEGGSARRKSPTCCTTCPLHERRDAGGQRGHEHWMMWQSTTFSSRATRLRRVRRHDETMKRIQHRINVTGKTFSTMEQQI